MCTEEYKDYLKSDEWYRKREEKARKMNYTCESCGKIVVKGYHIHHKTYKHLYNEPLSDLQFLCEECHKKFHEEKTPVF